MQIILDQAQVEGAVLDFKNELESRESVTVDISKANYLAIKDAMEDEIECRIGVKEIRDLVEILEDLNEWDLLGEMGVTIKDKE